MKGIEGFPLKFILMILIAAIIVGALVHVTGLLVGSAANQTIIANDTLTSALNKTLEDVLRNSTID